MKINKLIVFALLAGGLAACGSAKLNNDYFNVAFETFGGTPIPRTQKIRNGSFAHQPKEAPTLDGSTAVAWYTQSGLKFNFDSNPITEDITLYAKYWNGPEKYVIVNDYAKKFDEKIISEQFGSPEGRKVAVGEGVLIYIFQRPEEETLKFIRKHCSMSEYYDVPLLFELDPITFWDGVPELWNWFDKGGKGYNPENKENVEWYGWSSERAVKLGWLNWGSQIRLKPMCNLFSPRYQSAVKARMSTILSAIKQWYESLPPSKKYLLAGIKITGELAVGVNNWYYENGNQLYPQTASSDPKTGIDIYNKPSRSKGDVATIGYAGVKYAGIKSEGELTGDDIALLEKKFTLWLSEYVDTFGFGRELIFAHAGGVGNDLEACINPLVCPSWSFYGADAADVTNSTECMELLRHSDAPYWGVAEWAIGSSNPSAWEKAILSAFNIEGCRFFSMFCNVIGNNNGTTLNPPAIEGIKRVLYEE